MRTDANNCCPYDACRAGLPVEPVGKSYAGSEGGAVGEVDVVQRAVVDVDHQAYFSRVLVAPHRAYWREVRFLVFEDETATRQVDSSRLVGDVVRLPRFRICQRRWE